MSHFDLRGQTGIITAAGGRAGWVIATMLAAAGMWVVACNVDAAGLAQLASATRSIATLTGDLGEERDGAAAVARAEGRIDLLVNNVGIAGPTAAAEDVSLADWNDSLAGNLTIHFPRTTPCPHVASGRRRWAS